MTKILHILESIASDSKRSHKLAIVEANKHNDLFKRVLNLALNPYINFHIRQIPPHTQSTIHKTLDWALDQLDPLITRAITGNAAIQHLAQVLGSLDTEDTTVLARIIGKDLRCGMGDATVNAVIKGFIPTYPCLLARPHTSKNMENIQFPAYSQLKADGLRVNLHVANGQVTVCGRSGREIDLLGRMDAQILSLASKFDTPVVFDGELVVVDDQGQILPRKEGNGIINKAIKGTISDREARMVRAQLWDVIPVDQFKKGVSAKDYASRLTDLEQAIAGSTQITAITLIPSQIVNSLDEAVQHFQEMLAAGYEGTIIKNRASKWEDTRSKHLVKMKAELDADLEITGFNPGTGQFEGMVGSLIAASSDRKVVVSVSGFSHQLRREITDTIGDLMGKIMTVKYNERITSQGAGREGVDSLFLPRFQEFRSDKAVADHSDQIK